MGRGRAFGLIFFSLGRGRALYPWGGVGLFFKFSKPWGGVGLSG